MDEISRELPADATTPATGASGQAPAGERTKGPEELVTLDRGVVDADLVVRTRFAPGPLLSPEAMTPETIPSPETDAELPAAALPDEGAAGELAATAEAAAEAVVEAEPPPVAEVVAAEAAVVEPAIGEESIGSEAAVPEPLAEPLTEPVAVESSDIDAAAAAAAVAAETEVVEMEEEFGAEDEEGLPAVPELADAAAVAKVVFVLMLTSREGLSMLRLAQACNTTQKLVEEALALLQRQLRELGLPVELARTGDSVKWMSGPESFPYLQRLRGVKKLEKLSPAALETLAVIAYRQPVMRSEIEAIRGVKAGPMLRTLLQHKLVTCTGRADVPGRPLQYGTTQQFLERFGIGTLQELPSLKEWKNLG